VRIVDLRATPIAVGDPPLRSAFGLHAPFALRTIVEVETEIILAPASGLV